MSKKVIILVFLPWLLSETLRYCAEFSYVIAWLGSFFIFYLTIRSPFRCISPDLPASKQVMRPVVLLQLVFAGFMCCTSIFYFIDHIHFSIFFMRRSSPFTTEDQMDYIAKCQRLSLLAHCALVSGIIAATNTNSFRKREVSISDHLLLKILIVCIFILRSIFLFLPGTEQFAQPLSNICVNCSMGLLFTGVSAKDKSNILFSGAFFALNLVNALLSGFKEAIILQIIQVIFFAYPHYKKTVQWCSVPLICLLLYVLPTFTMVFRDQAWNQKKNKEQAGMQAYTALLEEDNEQAVLDNSWEFLTNRFSEIGMFVIFVRQFPDHQAYYGLEILENSLVAILPRIFWTEKPNTEKLAMERVYRAGIVNRASVVSAKTRPVVDAYLMAGAFGIFFVMLIYGAIAQSICNLAESLFGGYFLGCTVMFNGLFQCLWRGNTFEFLINNVVYSWILMLLISKALKLFHIVTPISSDEDHTRHSLL